MYILLVILSYMSGIHHGSVKYYNLNMGNTCTCSDKAEKEGEGKVEKSASMNNVHNRQSQASNVRYLKQNKTQLNEYMYFNHKRTTDLTVGIVEL